MIRIIFVLVIPITIACNNRSSASYEERLNAKRAFKSAGFYGVNSPLDESQKKSFKGLSFFKPDTNFIVNAYISWERNPKPVQLYNDSTESLKYSVARVNFNFDKQSYELVAFADQPKQQKKLFIPFYDLSNGRETYGGGRYLDVESANYKTVILDFNMAYNPYCVYNDNYVCPVPPEVNLLEFSISAGEKLPLIENVVH